MLVLNYAWCHAKVKQINLRRIKYKYEFYENKTLFFSNIKQFSEKTQGFRWIQKSFLLPDFIRCNQNIFVCWYNVLFFQQISGLLFFLCKIPSHLLSPHASPLVFCHIEQLQVLVRKYSIIKQQYALRKSRNSSLPNGWKEHNRVILFGF